ncbi:inhibitor of vertebrate lysozyme family protein [Chromobacterium sp. IIBBL 290-4]|uniref:inhibitor of vertebrate lysozyme family protein n=1 Tax=Chromobacterium sp. IIBBL 290-4 TaxID=2953890 RepID=UPI0020B86416|nr:inhibitor of vertebrate lysozyme family protein [Chromobacterium sp. IIBBL 290-4]UTH75255.1 inhibitor of vertebrate lysozyme family protein [Chromobacterium sp. IIBBL 290-4]
MKILPSLALAIALGAALPSMAEDAQAVAVFAELPAKPDYHAAWLKMLSGEKSVPRWLRAARATSSPYQAVTIDGKKYLAGDMCKPHDCFNHRFLGLFSADKQRAWGLLVTVADTPGAMEQPAKHARLRWFGNPDPAQRDYLNGQLQADPNWK